MLAGGHYDGHDISQAALDDGAGTIVALEAARVLASLPAGSIDRTIRFVLFCGEEVGLFGSWQYTKDHENEVDRTRFMLNLDGAGRGKGGNESVSVSGRPELMPWFEEHARKTNYRMQVIDHLTPHSDHFPVRDPGHPDRDAAESRRFGDDGRARLGSHRGRHVRQGDPARVADVGDGDGAGVAGDRQR